MPSTRIPAESKNFVAAVKYFMADKGRKSMNEVAADLAVPPVNLYKIMDGSNKPTIELYKILARKGGFNMNWLTMGIGDKYLKTQASLNSIQSAIESLATASR